MTPRRPYTRCQSCGTKFGAAREVSICATCRDGQAYLWVLPYAPASFAPIPQENKRRRGRK